MDRRAGKVEVDMSAILLAVFDDHPIAERVRVSLVRDGFPTDRVELTASCEPGRAGLGPADSGTTQVLRVYGWLKDGVFIRMLPRGRGGARAIRSAVFE